MSFLFVLFLLVISNGKLSDWFINDSEQICCKDLEEQSCMNDNRCHWAAIQCLSKYEDLCTDYEHLKICPHNIPNSFNDMPTLKARNELLNHTNNQWPKGKEIIYVTDGVYSLTGYDLANMIIIETNDGLVIIDTLGEASASYKAINDFRNKRISEGKSRKELYINSIFLTHNHVDHSFGTGGIFDAVDLNNNETMPMVYTNKLTFDMWERFIVYSAGIIGPRSFKQFGGLMYHDIPDNIVRDKKLFLNSGIGPHLNKEDNSSLTEFENVVFITEEIRDFIIGDVPIKVIHAPGETTDQSALYIESKKTIFAGDNFYRAFPNLYTIRGTPARDPKLWSESVLLMRNYKAEYLVGSHTRPLIGKEYIYNELTNYHDGIRFVHDQTVRYMNKFWETDRIIKEIEKTIPNSYKEGTMYQFYGSIEWSVRSIVDLYVGWFDGEPSSLYPASRNTRGQGYFELFKELFDGNNIAMMQKIINYLENQVIKEAQCFDNENDINVIARDKERFLLEITTYLSTLYDKDTNKCNEYNKLMQIRWELIRTFAGRSISANGRNYLTTSWIQEEYGIDFEQTTGEILDQIPIDWFMSLFRLRVAPEKSIIHGIVDSKYMLVYYTDTQLKYKLEIRGGILVPEQINSMDEFNDLRREAYLVVELPEIAWRTFDLFNSEYITKPRIGGIINLALFFSAFDLPVTTGDGLFKNKLAEILSNAGINIIENDSAKQNSKPNNDISINNYNENVSRINRYESIFNKYLTNIINNWVIILIFSVILSIIWSCIIIAFWNKCHPNNDYKFHGINAVDTTIDTETPLTTANNNNNNYNSSINVNDLN